MTFEILRFSFVSRVIFTNWENPLLNYDRIYRVRQCFYNTKVLRAVRLIEIYALMRKKIKVFDLKL